MPLIPISCSSVSCCRRCLRCAKRERTRKRCSFCSAVSCWRLLLRCSRWIWSWRSRSRGVSVINLPGRGFGATSCAYVLIAITWKLCFTRLGNRRRSLCCVETQNAPGRHWRLPSIYSEKDLFIAPRIWQLAETTRGYQTARALRARKDYKVATLGAESAELRSE